MNTRFFNLLLSALLFTPMAVSATDTSALKQDEMELGASYDALGNGYASWNSLYLAGSHRFGKYHSVYGELRETQRFGLHDREISGGYALPLEGGWSVVVEASKSPEHNVLPKDSLFGQVQKAFDGGWDIQAGLRRSQYNTASNNITMLTAERYWGDFRAAYRLYLNKLQDAGTASSHNGQLSYYYGERDYFTLNLTSGRQVENLGPGRGVLASDVTGSSLSGYHWPDPAWGLSYDITVERLGNLYTRKGFRLGLRHTF